MKKHMVQWKMLIREIDAAVDHSRREGLPLKSIELDKTEWDDFVTARTTLSDGRILPITADMKAGRVIYKGVSVFRGPAA